VSDQGPGRRESFEQLVSLAKGQKGDKGETGAAGQGMTRGARRAVIFLFALAVALAGMNLLFTSVTVNHLRSAVLAQCQFNADLGAAPVTVSPSTGRASRLGVLIISDSRTAWHGLGCPGRLPPPAPSFAKWAKTYHLPVG